MIDVEITPGTLVVESKSLLLFFSCRPEFSSVAKLDAKEKIDGENPNRNTATQHVTAQLSAKLQDELSQYCRDQGLMMRRRIYTVRSY